jgi:hypothetical protein
MQRPCYLSERGVEPWQLQDFWPRPPYPLIHLVAPAEDQFIFLSNFHNSSKME